MLCMMIAWAYIKMIEGVILSLSENGVIDVFRNDNYDDDYDDFMMS